MTRFTIAGLDDLRTALRNLPADLKGEAAHLVAGQGNAAAVEIRTAYGARSVTGNLASHVTVDPVGRAGAHGAAVVVKSTARHAHLIEQGTQVRKTAKGYARGSAPPIPIFVPILIRRRRTLDGLLADLLRRHGLTVRGEGGI